jgi:hypothetical protein
MTTSKRVLMALMLVTAFVSPAHASNDQFRQMLAQTGCDSKYNDDKKADLYSANYEGKPMSVTGSIKVLDGADVSVKVLPSTFTFDVTVTLADRKAAYNLEKGQRISLNFDVAGQGGCFLPFTGKHGVIAGSM